jgi:exodeoxyribonuclease VII small subunit
VSEQRDSYEATKARLEEISAAARAKDVTLEKSIELLEEAVRLANLCTEHVDQVETFAVPAPEAGDEPVEDTAAGERAEDAAADAGEDAPWEDADATGASDGTASGRPREGDEAEADAIAEAEDAPWSQDTDDDEAAEDAAVR